MNQITNSVGKVDEGKTFVSISDSKQDEPSLKNEFAPLKSRGFKYENGAFRELSIEEVNDLKIPKEGISFSSVVGDFFQWLGDGVEYLIDRVVDGVTYLKKGISFILSVVDEGLKLVFTIAGKIFDFLLDTFIVAFKALNWLLNLIGIDLTAILRWLGHLFGWDQMWENHKRIAALFQQFMDYGVIAAESAVEYLKGYINHYLTGLGDKLKKEILPNIDPKYLKNNLSQTQKEGKDTTKDTEGSLNSGPGNFSFYHILNSIGSIFFGGGGDGSGPTEEGIFGKFYKDIIAPTFQVLEKDISRDIDDLIKLLTTDQSVGNVVNLLGDLVDTIIDPIRTIITGALDFSVDILKFFQTALTASANVPFIGSLYKLISTMMGDDRKFSVLNGLALLISIPLTLVLKISGKVPVLIFGNFQDGNIFDTVLGPAESLFPKKSI